MSARDQLALNFEPGLTARFRTLEDCCSAVVHGSRDGVDGVAGSLDMAPSELSRRLNAHLPQREGESNNRPLRISDFVGIIAKTGDLRPIYWLVEKFANDPGCRENAGADADRAVHADDARAIRTGWSAVAQAQITFFYARHDLAVSAQKRTSG